MQSASITFYPQQDIFDHCMAYSAQETDVYISFTESTRVAAMTQISPSPVPLIGAIQDCGNPSIYAPTAVLVLQMCDIHN
jgi:hypothetical protein